LQEWHFPAVTSLETEALAARKRPHFMHNASDIRPSRDNTATFMDASFGIAGKNLAPSAGKGK
jgi:hypothetical protein